MFKTTFTVFAENACTELEVFNDTGVEIEYRRNGAGTALVIRPGQTRRIVGITNANQIGFRRVDNASGIARSSAITARALTTNEVFVSAGIAEKLITNGGANTQFDSLACTALELINTTGKMIVWRVGTTAAYRRLKDGESVIINNITNANQVYVKAYDSIANVLRAVQIECFNSRLTQSLNLSRQITQISSGARIVLDDFNYPTSIGATNLFVSVAEQADQKTTLVPKNSTALAFFPTVSSIPTNRAANFVDSSSGDFLFGSTSVEYTHPGAFATAAITAVVHCQ